MNIVSLERNATHSRWSSIEAYETVNDRTLTATRYKNLQGDDAQPLERRSINDIGASSNSVGLEVSSVGEREEAVVVVRLESAIRLECANSSVVPVGTPISMLEAQLDRIIAAAHEEEFEPGMESTFFVNLQRLFSRYPLKALESLRERMASMDGSPEVLAELLRWTSGQDSPVVRDRVLALLGFGLAHRSSIVRDSAATGLAALLEGEAVPLLMRAIEREVVPELRDDLEDLIRSLERWHP